MAKRTKEKKEVNPPRSIVHNFENNLYNLEFFITSLIPLVINHDSRAKKGLDDYRAKLGKIISSSVVPLKDELREADNGVHDERISPLINEIVGVLREHDWQLINITLSDQRCDLLWRSSFMMLIAYFDFLLSDLLHCYYDKYPKALNEEMTLSYGELRTCSDLNEAIHMLMDRKIESLLFKNFTEQIRFFKDDLKINIAENIIKWDIINEAYQRRNIIIHNNGIVNGRYMKNIMHSNRDRKLKEGDRLTISAKYYLRAYMEILVGGIILIQNCWRKWFKDDMRGADSTLMDSINKGLLVKEFEVARRLVVFSKEIKEYYEENKHILDILYCYALKKESIHGEFKEEMKKLERDGLSLRCLIALAVLEDDKKAFYENVAKAAKIGELDKVEFNVTAIYREFIEDDDFVTKLDEAFK